MRNSELFFDRLEECLHEKGIKKSELARNLGIAQASIVAWKKKGFTPSLEIAYALGDFFDVSVRWLVWGEGEKADLTYDSKYEQIIKTYDKLSEEKRQELLNYGNYLSIIK